MRLTGVFMLAVVIPALVWLTWHAWLGGLGWRWLVIRAAAAVYAGVIAGLAFFPFPLPPWDPADAIVQPWILPIPLQTISMSLGLDLDQPLTRYLVGNVVAFIPVGVFLPLLRPHAHAWRRALATGLAISLAIEITQLALSSVIGYPYRQFDVDDLLLNTLGAGLGYGGWRLTLSTIQV